LLCRPTPPKKFQFSLPSYFSSNSLAFKTPLPLGISKELPYRGAWIVSGKTQLLQRSMYLLRGKYVNKNFPKICVFLCLTFLLRVCCILKLVCISHLNHFTYIYMPFSLYSPTLMIINDTHTPPPHPPTSRTHSGSFLPTEINLYYPYKMFLIKMKKSSNFLKRRTNHKLNPF